MVNRTSVQSIIHDIDTVGKHWYGQTILVWSVNLVWSENFGMVYRTDIAQSKMVQDNCDYHQLWSICNISISPALKLETYFPQQIHTAIARLHGIKLDKPIIRDRQLACIYASFCFIVFCSRCPEVMIWLVSHFPALECVEISSLLF